MSGGEPTPTLPDGSADRDEAYCSACGQSFSPDLVTCPNDGARLIKLAGRRDDLIGRVLEGRYEVRARLGAGGMGTVYRGWQLSVDREVAIKVIDLRLSSDRIAVKRFLREARLSSRLGHPNIVNVYDFGQTDDGVLYIAMEMLNGKTLAQELAGAAITVRRAAGFVSQLCDALEHAHARDIIHRDLKPGNIVVLDGAAERDVIKVLDFGLAKSLATDARSQVTKTDAMLGTPLYMAPEQIDGKPSDQRADLYALGCMFFEMLAARPPFVDANMHAVLGKHLNEPPPPLPPTVPPSVSALVRRLLAKAPDDRPASAAEVKRTLQAALAGASAEASAARPAPPSIVVRADAQTAASISALGPTLDSASARGEIVPARVGRRRVVAALAALAALAVIVVVAIVGSGGGVERAASPDSRRPDATAAAAPLDAHVVLVVDTSPPADVTPPPRSDARSSRQPRPPAADAGVEAVSPVDAPPPPQPRDAPDLTILYQD